MGKARGSADINDFIKHSINQGTASFGNQRYNGQGSGNDRGTDLGSIRPDTTSLFKLDTRGGIMKGALGFKGVATSELGASGIIDMSDYHIPRLYITNTSLNTLKAIIPSMGDGQETWIRANGGVSFTIQNTAGTGDETTGNIELMAGSDYTITGDDWICFHYDSSDSKYHQVTAGKQNIGGGGGGSSNQIIQGDSSITITDVGVGGAIVGVVDSIQMFNISPTAINLESDVILGSVSANEITFNGSLASTIPVKTDASFDIGDVTHRLVDIYASALKLDATNNIQLSTGGFTGNVGAGDTYIFNVNSSSKFQISGTTIDLRTDVILGVGGGNTVIFNGVLDSDIDMNANALILDADGDTKIQSGTDDVFQLTVGGSVRFSLSTASAILTEPLSCSDIRVSGGDRVRSSSSTEIGYFVKNATSSLGSEGSMQMPVISSLTPTVANLDAAFGSEIGCFGLYNTAAANVVLAIKNQASEWIVIACGDASATVVSDHIN